MDISLSAFAPEILVSRDGFGSPVPRQPAHLRTQAESGTYLHGIPPDFRGGVHLFLNRHLPVAPVAQRYHVTSDTLGREFDPVKRDFSH